MRVSAVVRGGLVSRRLRSLACATIVLSATVISARPAEAQVVYTYTGNEFTRFSCGLDAFGQDLSCPAPGAGTSYTTSNRLTITIELANPLPPNLFQLDGAGNPSVVEIWQLPGFRLTITDGLQTLTFGDPDSIADGLVAAVRTDAAGRIIDWDLGLSFSGTTGLMESMSFATPVGMTGSDLAYLRLSDGVTAGDFAFNANSPGTWTYPSTGPDAAVRALIALLSDPSLGLTQGQIKSLTDKLNNVLASIASGDTAQARNQLTAFINQVIAAISAGKMSSATGTTLLTAANLIMAML